MNNDRFIEIKNFLLDSRCLKFIVLLLIALGAVGFAWYQYIVPEISSWKISYDSVKNNIKTIEEKKKELHDRELQKKMNKVVIKDVDVKIYQPKYKGLSLEASAIDFVTNLITMLEKTDNEILDLSYNSTQSTVSTEPIPSGVKTIRFYIEMNSTYTSYYRLLNELFSLPYLVSVKTVKMEPFLENKNNLHVDMIVHLYVK